MLKVLIAGLLGTVAGIAVMVVVIVVAGGETDNTSSVGLNASVSTAVVSAPASAPASSAPSGGTGTGGSSNGASSNGATGDANAGKTVFASSGCGSCHTLSAAGATGTIGPDLDKEVTPDAQKDNMPLGAFIKESITDPGAYTASGGPWTVQMPSTFGSQLSASQINDLVALIESSQSS